MVNNDLPLLPVGWEWKTLGECFQWGSGGTPLRSHTDYYDGDIPWVIIGDLNDGIITETKTKITEKGLNNSSAKWVEPGSILIAMYGSIGKLGIAGRRLTTNQAIAFTSPDQVVLQYLFYYLLGQRSALNQLGIGATQLNISQTILKAHPFPVAPYQEQQRIVAKIEELFSQLDAAEAALKRAKANLKRYRQSVLQAAVTGELTRAWREAHAGEIEPAGALLERIRAERRAKWEAEQRAKGKDPAKEKYVEPQGPDTSKLPELPEGWVWVSLSSITTQIGDVDHKMPKAVNSEIPYISTRDFRDNGEIDFETAKKISIADYSSLSRKIYPTKGDILLSRYGTVGEVRVVKTERPFQASYSIAIVKPLHNSVSVDYLAYLLQAKVSQDQIKRYTRATAQPDLGLAHIKLIMIPLATLMEQRQIMLEIERQISVTQKLEVLITESQSRIISLKQKILEFAFKGEL